MKPSLKASQFTESVIREMTRLNQRYGGVNLSQGFPDFPAPAALKDAACRAVMADVNQYAVTWGTKAFREAIAAKFTRTYGLPVDADTQVTVCCGATEAMIATMMALIDPGDEAIVFEPFYENYGPDAILSGATPRFVTLHPSTPLGAGAPDVPAEAGTHGDEAGAQRATWCFDPEELAAAFNERTRAVILNTPNNPTGKVFTQDELEIIAALCRKWDVVAISDEIYEHIVYDDCRHVPIATVEGMADRTVTINSLSKTYSVTGWRVGWTISPPWLTGAIRKVHDFLTVGAAAPLQEAGVVALSLPESYYAELAQAYTRRRNRLLDILRARGFTCDTPGGAYYIMTDIAAFGFPDDVACARYLVKDVGVATVPGSSFYRDPAAGRTTLRFCFCKRDETLDEADRRLAAVALPLRSGQAPQYLATPPK